MASAPKSKWTIVILAFGLAIAVLVLAGLSANLTNTLVAKKVAAGPVLDGAVDAVWNQAQPLTFKVTGGRQLIDGSTEVTLRALYTAENAFFLIQYKDPTESLQRAPWQKQADGSWKLLGDPEDKGGDNNVYYEDKFAILWNISSPAFEQQGCMSTCHPGQGKPFGNKYTKEEGARLDLWHWKSVRTGSVRQIDDQYVDSTKYDKANAPDAGRKSDPKTAGGYADNINDAKTGPKFALKGNIPAPPYWIVDSEKVAFEDSKYKAGDEVPGIIVAPLVGDRGDISVKSSYKDGGYTVEFSRKLVTGGEFDVQFNDLKKQFAFGVAIFDNAQVRHAFSNGVFGLKFE
jgi:hypothetical protein